MQYVAVTYKWDVNWISRQIFRSGLSHEQNMVLVANTQTKIMCICTTEIIPTLVVGMNVMVILGFQLPF